MIPQKNSVEQFIDLIQSGIDSWLKAAELARSEIERDEDWPEKVQAKAPLILTSHSVRRFANIGVKYIPQLAVSEAPGARALRRLPLKLQEKFIASPLPLLIENKNGWETLLVDLHNLTSDQAEQIFHSDHIRTDAEQRAWIEDKKAKRAAPSTNAGMPFRIVKGSLVIIKACTIQRKQLAGLLAEMEN